MALEYFSPGDMNLNATGVIRLVITLGEFHLGINSDLRVQNDNKIFNFTSRSLPCFKHNLVGRGRVLYNALNLQSCDVKMECT